KFLPQGWDLDVANSGPTKDINLRLTFIDRLTAQDAEGKALDPVRVITLGIPAKKTGSETRGTMLFRIYSSSAAGVPGLMACQSRPTRISNEGFGLTRRGPPPWRNRRSYSPRMAIPSSFRFNTSAARRPPARPKT